MTTTTNLINEPVAIQTKHPRIIGDILAIISGAILPLAFAPFNLYVVAILSPAFLLMLWLITSPKRAFLRGWLFGLGFFGVGVSWVYVSIHTFGQAPMILAALITILFIMILALFPAVHGYLLARFFPQNSIAKCLLAFPALWVILEWMRELIFTGFPWLLLGYSQITMSSQLHPFFTPLKGLAPILSVYGISWALVFTSGALVNLFIPKKWHQQLLIIISLIILWLGSGMLAQINWTKPLGNPIKISMVQGNIPQTVKWNPAQVTTTLNLYHRLTKENLTSKIIVWPEAAITLLQTQAQDYLSQLDALTKAHNITLITGIPIQQGEQYYNGMIALGSGQGVYLKRHLVPFGEFMPLRWLLGWLHNYIIIPMADFTSGTQQQEPFIANGIAIAPFICYEIAYPNEVLNLFPQAKLIIVATDDSWFGDSLAPAQHLQMAQMRALETGRYLLNSTNNGVTAIINPHGQVQAFATPFQVAVITGTVQAMQGTTPVMYWKTYLIISLMWLLLIAAFFIAKYRQKMILAKI